MTTDATVRQHRSIFQKVGTSRCSYMHNLRSPARLSDVPQVQIATKYPDPHGGGMVSLKDLGYLYVGLDDHWQNCTVICANGTVVPSWQPRITNGNLDYDYQCCHDADGTCEKDSTTIPWVSNGTDGTPYGSLSFDTHRFPNVRGMVDKAHSLGLRAGWYMVSGLLRDGTPALCSTV
jgi:hypothetical protein